MKRATLTIKLVNVLCPTCGECIPNPDNGAEGWTVEEIRTASRFRCDEVDAPMCAACGTFVRILFPMLPLPLERKG